MQPSLPGINSPSLFDLTNVLECWQAGDLVHYGDWVVGEGLFGDTLRTFVIGSNYCFHIKDWDPGPPKPLLHFRYCGPDNIFCTSLVSIWFGNGITNSKTQLSVNWVARSELNECGYCLAFQLHVGKPGVAIRIINVEKQVDIKSSAPQLDSAVQKRLLERLKRV
jgi:hypothetical protein